MKIVLTTESFRPNISGVSIFTERLANELAKKKYEVFVFAPSSDKTQKVEISDNYKVYYFKSKRNPFRKGYRIVMGQKKEIAQVLDEIKPDLIHFQDPNGVSMGAQKWAKKSKVPTIGTYHFSLDFVMAYLKPLKPISPAAKKGLAIYINKFFNSCKFVTCPTQHVRQALLKQGIKRPIYAISNGIDYDRFQEKKNTSQIYEKYNISKNKHIVLHIGRIDMDKNIDILLKSVPLVAKKIPNIHFVLGGGGDKLDYFKDWVKEQSLTKYVTFLGRVEHENPDLAKIYQLADVFAIPSRIETQSLVTMEAMAAGLPIVAADAGALPELVSDGKNGYLVLPKSEEDMAAKIVRIIRDPKLKVSMGDNSQLAIEAHRMENTVEKFIATYREAVNAKIS